MGPGMCGFGTALGMLSGAPTLRSSHTQIVWSVLPEHLGRRPRLWLLNSQYYLSALRGPDDQVEEMTGGFARGISLQSQWRQGGAANVPWKEIRVLEVLRCASASPNTDSKVILSQN